MSTLEQQRQFQEAAQQATNPNGRAVAPPPGYDVPRPQPGINLFTFLSLALRALSGHALKWVGLALAFALFGWIVVEAAQPAWAKLAAAGSFGVMVLVLWLRAGERR